jgi:hypothetical protein
MPQLYPLLNQTDQIPAKLFIDRIVHFPTPPKLAFFCYSDNKHGENNPTGTSQAMSRNKNTTQGTGQAMSLHGAHICI